MESWLERRFLAAIRRAGLPEPNRQRVYRSDGRHVAHVDFDFEPVPLVVEVGGRRRLHQRGRNGAERNAGVTNFSCTARRVSFCTTEDVRDDERYVLATLRSALGLAA